MSCGKPPAARGGGAGCGVTLQSGALGGGPAALLSHCRQHEASGQCQTKQRCAPALGCSWMSAMLIIGQGSPP